MNALLILSALMTGLTDNDFGRPVVRNYWIQLKVVEEDEWLMRSNWNFADDLGTAYERWLKITPQTPPFEAQHHLPTLDAVRDAICCQRQFERYLEAVAPYRHSGEQQELDRIMDDLWRRQQLWNLIGECRSPYGSSKGRRLKLQELMEMVGPKAFYEGYFPHPLPDAARNSVWEPIDEPMMEVPQ